MYKYCNQNFLSLHVFPPLPIFQPEYGQWMTQEQVRVTTIYGWTSVAVISFFVVVFFWRFGRALGSLFYGGYKVSAKLELYFLPLKYPLLLSIFIIKFLSPATWTGYEP